MKKYMVLCAGVCLALSFVGCKSSESAYKKAYEKAKAQDVAPQTNTDTTPAEVNVVTPLVEKPVSETVVVDNVDNVQVIEQQVSLVDGSGLKAYSVVVGSFSLKANADDLQRKLKAAGNDAQVVRYEAGNMYRVVVATFDSKVDATACRNQFRAQYPDAWLLYTAR